MEYHKIVKHYENCFYKYGDNNKGVDWPNEDDALKRYNVMLDLVRFDTLHIGVKKPYTLLDFGCGLGHLLKYIIDNDRLDEFNYVGMDLSDDFISHCKKKYPEYNWIKSDILKESGEKEYDYIIANGVFTEKKDFSQTEFFNYFCTEITRLYEMSKYGIAFNVMSSHVDWEREDLFHLPIDQLADFLVEKLTRDFIVRNDYGLYEYTVYVYKR